MLRARTHARTHVMPALSHGTTCPSLKSIFWTRSPNPGTSRSIMSNTRGAGMKGASDVHNLRWAGGSGAPKATATLAARPGSLSSLSRAKVTRPCAAVAAIRTCKHDRHGTHARGRGVLGCSACSVCAQHSPHPPPGREARCTRRRDGWSPRQEFPAHDSVLRLLHSEHRAPFGPAGGPISASSTYVCSQRRHGRVSARLCQGRGHATSACSKGSRGSLGRAPADLELFHHLLGEVEVLVQAHETRARDLQREDATEHALPTMSGEERTRQHCSRPHRRHSPWRIA